MNKINLDITRGYNNFILLIYKQQYLKTDCIKRRKSKLKESNIFRRKIL
jgi:hypothetical protein